MLLLVLKPFQSLSKGKLDTQVSCLFVRHAFSNAFNKQWYENAVCAAHTLIQHDFAMLELISIFEKCTPV